MSGEGLITLVVCCDAFIQIGHLSLNESTESGVEETIFFTFDTYVLYLYYIHGISCIIFTLMLHLYMHIHVTFWHKFRIYPIRKTKVTTDQISLIERNYFTFGKMTECLD